MIFRKASDLVPAFIVRQPPLSALWHLSALRF
jgi:hypothetical protein